MAKRLNSYQVNLQFTADAKQAQQQLENLQRQLDVLATSAIKNSAGTGLSSQITESAMAAQQLKVQLQEATNVNTGKLDLSKFTASLKASNMDLNKYANILKSLGPEGSKAFSNLATAISQSEMPLRRTNALLAETWTTLKNTARWQFSSSLLHGFVGSVQQAYGYAQDLNESLNNIRIVTGQSADQMAKFAVQANKAAKQLSTTTTKYTDAALIYYQQGLSDEEVKERTDITIKMANVAHESSEIVSDQMTAVWNNFYDGSQSLEHYADAMVRLGADTASSSDEIAGGLEKFAAVANTIGLSFDNAAAALATITATTRQSEDVVGTALKTIFARIQGLKLGETLEDGTTLNQYSQALEKVGINIKDSSGELKDMDNIIEEMGNKWQSIDKDQQVALAQQVAGVRQYTQLIALMDHFDYYKENLARAQSADGSLQEQANIYAEGWEAASKRVKASLETIYNNLLDDNFFINLTDGAADLLDVLNGIVKSLGGAKGLLLGISTIVLTKMRPEITKGIQDIAYSINTMMGKTQTENIVTKKQANSILSTMGDPNTIVGKSFNEAYSNQSDLQNTYLVNAKKISEAEQKIASRYMDQQKILIKNIELQAQEVEIAEKEVKIRERDVRLTANKAIRGNFGDTQEARDARNSVNFNLSRIESRAKAYGKVSSFENILGTTGTFDASKLDQLKTKIRECNMQAKDFGEAFGTDAYKAYKRFETALQSGNIKDTEKALQELNDRIVGADPAYEILVSRLKQYYANLDTTEEQQKVFNQQLDQVVAEADRAGQKIQHLGEQQNILANFTQIAKKAIDEMAKSTMTMTDSFVAFAGSLSSFGMILSQINGIMDTFNDESISTKDKIIGITTSLGFLIPMIGSFAKGLGQSRFFLGEIGAQLGVAATGTNILTKSLGTVKIAGADAAISLASVGMGLTAIIGTVAILAGAVLLIKTIVDAFNDAAIGLDNATEAAKKATQALTDTQNTFNSLKSDIENYQGMQNAFDNLTKGTLEWNQALRDNNEQVLKMLEAYPELWDYFKKDSNGKYYFTDTDTIQQIYDDKITEAQNTAMIAQANKAVAQHRSDVVDSVRDNSSFDIYGADDFLNQISKSALTGGAMGLMGGAATGIGAVIGAPIGLLTGAITGLIAAISENEKSNQESEEAFSLLQEAYQKQGELVLTNEDDFKEALDGISEDVVDALWVNHKAIGEQIKALNDNTEQLKTTLEGSAAGYNQDNEIYQGMNDTEQAIADAYIANRVNNSIINNDKDYQNAKNRGQHYLATDNYDEILSTIYGDDADNYRVKPSGNKYKIQTQNSEGEWVDSKTLTANQFAEEFATAVLMQMTDADKEAVEQIKSVGDALQIDLTGKSDKEKEDYANQVLDLEKQIINGQGITLKDFSEEAVVALENGIKNSEFPEDIAEKLIPAINDYNTNQAKYAGDRYLQQAEYSKSNSETLNGILNAYATGENLSDEQTAYLDSLCEKYTQLNDLRQQGGHEYLQLLRDIQEEEETNYLQSLENARNAQVEQANKLSKEIQRKENALNDPTISEEKKSRLEIELQAKTDEFDKIMDQIQNTDYSIQVAIDADLKSDVDQAFGLADEFDQLSNYLSDGLKISVERAQEIINAGYGEMLTGAKETTDGMIQLDQDKLNSFIDSKQSELNADKDSKIKQLELEREMLVAKQQSTEKAIEILEAGAQASTGVSKAEALAKASYYSAEADSAVDTEEIKADAVDQGNQEIATDTQDLINDLGLMYQDNATNVGTAYEDAAINAENSAKAQINAINQVQLAAVNQSNAIKNSATGTATYNPIIFHSSKTSSKKTTSKTTSSSYSTTEANFEDLKGKILREAGKKDDPMEWLDQAINSALSQQKQKLQGINNQIGSIDAAIAALKSANINIDSLQKGLGKTSGSTDKSLQKIAERYHEITREIEYQEKALDKLDKITDTVYGKDRIDNLDQEIKANEKLLDLQTQLYKLVLANVTLDQQTVQNKFGGKAIFNKDTLEIENYTKLYESATTDEQREALEQYEETLDKLKEQEATLIDIQNTIRELHYEKLTYEVEVKIKLDENDTKKLEYYFDKLSDNIYKAAEALGYLQGQFDPVISQLGTYENFYGQLNNAYSNGEISQENYIEGLQDVYDNTLDNLNALQDLDKEMLEYYGNTIDLANDELSKYTDHMEHLTSVLDHYRSIITLLGKDKDYDKVLSVLNGTAQTKKNNFDTSKQWYESLKRERDAAAAALASSTDEAEREVLQKNYDAILAAFDEAEEDMLSKAEEYGEALKEILTTKMEQAADEMNKQLSTTKVSINGNNFNISGWDALNDALDRMSSYQDEYLTKTNQIYEMNKLLNNVNQAIDKTNNQAAKNRYQQFTKEIEQLRDKDKLSQLELEIAQAKYKVLEAQIALEEAQNAKSTVRLQRDNEGNFGYVYTADQEKVNDAQQALADAENDLYNIRLDATNKYGQQKLQYEKELAEKLAELDQKAAEDAVYRETTYQQERALVIQQYTDLITTAGNLYAKAQEEDSRVVQDAWVNSFDIIKDNSNSWKDTITENTNIINDTFKEWQDSMDEISKIVGDDLKDTQQKVKDVTDESNKLYQEVSNKVIPALEGELSSVRSATEAWAQHRQQLLDTIKAYEELLNAIQATLRAQSGFGSNSDKDTDWAAMMGTVAYGSAEYNQYKNIRDAKIANGKKINYDTTARVDAYYKLLSEGKISGLPNGKQNFTQLTDEEWRKLVGFRSGGYTGTWNDDGKLAFLHQKELVLNADDTENMLASIQLVRQIAKQLDFNSQQISTLSSSGFTVSSQDGTLEQNVRIEASFPNATDRYEIQEAFNTLVNVASQYANRK